MTLWNYTKMGLQQGPVPEEELRQKIRRGEIGDATLVWREGMADWLPLSEVEELKQPVAAAPVSAAPAEMPPQLPESTPPMVQAAVQQQGHVPLPQPPAYQGNYIAPHIPNYLWQSIVALVISCLLMLVICLPIGMPFAIVALVYAARVEGLRVQGNHLAAGSASRNAKVWMIISYSFSGLSLLGVLAVLGFAAMA